MSEIDHLDFVPRAQLEAVRSDVKNLLRDLGQANSDRERFGVALARIAAGDANPASIARRTLEHRDD